VLEYSTLAGQSGEEEIAESGLGSGSTLSHALPRCSFEASNLPLFLVPMWHEVETSTSEPEVKL
jgi:hypothetical protein